MIFLPSHMLTHHLLLFFSPDFFYSGLWWSIFIKFLPFSLRPKPSAKTGVRTYVSSSVSMNKLISESFSSEVLEKIKVENENKKKSSSIMKEKKNIFSAFCRIFSIMINKLISRIQRNKYFGNGSINNNDNGNKNEIKKLNPKTSGSAESRWVANNNNNNKKIIDNNISNDNNNINENIDDKSNSNKNIDNNVDHNIENLHVVGLFVYAWISPELRGMFFGDILLESGQRMCRELGANFMILVHDDNGSGRLISYYEKKGFLPIFDTIEKGMIGYL